MDCKLILTTSGIEESFSLREGISAIGRDSDNDIQLMSPGVSRHHAEINNMPCTCELEDLSSANGTLVNGVRISVVRLKNGDEIQMGDCRLRFVEYAEDSGNDDGKRYEYSERAGMDTVMIKRPPEESGEKPRPEKPRVQPLKPKS